MPWLELGITARALILPIETHGKLAKFDAPAGSTCWQSLELGTSVNFRELSETKGQLTQRPNVGVRTRAQHKLNSFTSAFSTGKSLPFHHMCQEAAFQLQKDLPFRMLFQHHALDLKVR